MIAPEDVLLETIAAVIRDGDSSELRRRQCAKLKAAILAEGGYYAVPFEPIKRVSDD